MRDLRQAKGVLAMAHKDLRALKAMMDVDAFDDEIFGFHAQQAIEKSLKAWIALLGREGSSVPKCRIIEKRRGPRTRFGTFKTKNLS